jgi:hypothetical protein
MKGSLIILSLLALIVLVGFAGSAFAQDTHPAIPRFVVLPPHPQTQGARPASNLAQWNGSFKDFNNITRNFVMVGADPAISNKTTTIPTFIIPIKMVYGPSNGNKTFSPKHVLPDGNTVLKDAKTSPLFKNQIDFVQGGTDLGTGQYIDEYQRANFWKFVQINTNYHTRLGKPTMLAQQTINVTPAQGHVANEFGKTVGLMDINAFDAALQTYLTKFASQIKPNTLPIFLTYDIYLTSGGCCIGGYHSANGAQPAGQTYSYTTWVDQGNGVFSQDTAAFTHEIGEWQDDPFINNRVGCRDNSIMENGDPLVLHDFPYTVHGFTYHLQDLVFIPYFGAPRDLPINNWLSFQNDEKNICPH